MVYRVPSFLSVVIPLRATLARHRVQQVIHHLCRSGRGALDGVGIDFGGGGRIRMAYRILQDRLYQSDFDRLVAAGQEAEKEKL